MLSARGDLRVRVEMTARCINDYNITPASNRRRYISRVPPKRTFDFAVAPSKGNITPPDSNDVFHHHVNPLPPPPSLTKLCCFRESCNESPRGRSREIHYTAAAALPLRHVYTNIFVISYNNIHVCILLNLILKYRWREGPFRTPPLPSPSFIKKKKKKKRLYKKYIIYKYNNILYRNNVSWIVYTRIFRVSLVQIMSALTGKINVICNDEKYRLRRIL